MDWLCHCPDLDMACQGECALAGELFARIGPKFRTNLKFLEVRSHHVQHDNPWAADKVWNRKFLPAWSKDMLSMRGFQHEGQHAGLNRVLCQ